VLLFGVPLLNTNVRLLGVFGWWFEDSVRIFHWLVRAV
jgi:hypothetical protein